MNQNPNEKPGQQNQGGQASVDAQLVKLIRKARSVAHQAADFGKTAIRVDSRDPIVHRKSGELRSMAGEELVNGVSPVLLSSFPTIRVTPSCA
jgi:hypothetical protein